MKLPDNTKIQSVDLKIKDMVRSLNFYSGLMGFKVIEAVHNKSFLSASGQYPYLIKLEEDSSAIPRPRGTTGLFHAAIRFPNRAELARVFLRLFDKKVKFLGFSDHLVSEAMYLADPDENGVELYADRPKEEWVYKMGQIEMDTLPLNLSTLTSELKNRGEWNGIHPLTDIGHIHLNVSDLKKAQEIYSMLLGFNITNSLYSGALFFSAGGYHHHIGANVWSSSGGKPAPENTVGLSGFTISTPDSKYLEVMKKRSEDEGLLMESNVNNELNIRDLDNIKIKLVA
ncbi:MAG: VOC family protein [Ignavibacteria bacterium]|nr:VOC family protein [Ignavibacteria bacterium]